LGILLTFLAWKIVKFGKLVFFLFLFGVVPGKFRRNPRHFTTRILQNFHPIPKFHQTKNKNKLSNQKKAKTRKNM
jgi:hypothetical protein